MAEALKKQAFSGIFWSTFERFLVQGVQFLLQIVLARLLLPSDYGIIAMLAIFLQVAQVFVDSGFANALIQKQDCTEKDYSTVFYYNLGLSAIVYVILYFAAPYVASFYNIEAITPVMRVISLTIVFNALSIVQRTKLVKKIDFKSQMIVSLCSALLSGIIGIIMAYKGYGVWSLCAQSVTNSLSQVFFFYFFVRWRPQLLFSTESFKELFSFGSKILIAGIITVIYNNLYTIVIGKRFSSKELGYYSRADHFANFPSSNMCGILSRVSFPVLSKIQDDDNKLRSAYRLIIRYSSFIIFPIMIGLASVSYPLIEVLLGINWMPVAPILLVLCFAQMWDHLSIINLNLLYVKGKSGLVLKLEIIKKIIAVIILIITLPMGIISMCIGRVVYGVISFYINTFYTNKLVGISFSQQISDILSYLVLSLAIGAIVFFVVTVIPMSVYIKLIMGLLIYFVLYGLFTWVFFRDIRDRILYFVKYRKLDIN